MIDILGSRVTRNCQGVSRRDFLRVGSLSLCGLTVADFLRAKAYAATPATTIAPDAAARAKSVIQLWMGGGPPHLDTFDPKPEAGEDYCGPLRKPIATNASSGIQVRPSMPVLAPVAGSTELSSHCRVARNVPVLDVSNRRIELRLADGLSLSRSAPT